MIAYAKDKLQRKGLDMIVANDVSSSHIGFNSDDNEVTLITADTCEALAQTSKNRLARFLIDKIAARYGS